MICFVGPDFICVFAGGQLASARSVVKQFKEDEGVQQILNGRKWTLRHAFFVDMGGFILTSPDYDQGFPVNAEQLFYLVKHGYIDLPYLSEKEIKEKSKADTLSKLITIWHVAWFTITKS
ncbi:hypothetical protein INS49_009046 [Diaporthe citri]|uniref:uncharacterized protein n=1 Tax=Diaporthe citri TaxID=83186 RepID=UPI001C7F8ED0|nr:uncharacterized protein INS49_009046 [Diaporthe citri]KAG6363943.1 hypothetical protein INS49_009046 [Diaporthe citri]